MTIAFDVKGTIDGHYQEIVLKLFKALEARGHKMIVWSSAYDYAAEAIFKHKLKAEAMHKFTKDSVGWDDVYYIDLAIDDDSRLSRIIGAKRVLLVSEIPEENIEEFAATLG